MKPIRTLTALLVVLVALPAAAETKIGYVDLQRAGNEVDEGKAVKAQLKKDLEERQKMLDARKAELDRMRDDFQKQLAVLTDEAKKEKATELDQRMMELQNLYQKVQQELLKGEQEKTGPIAEKLSAIVREIAENDGFTMVVAREAVVYGAPALDITNELIRKYNARHPNSGPAASAATTPKAKAAAPKK